jgi:hypothetical protein
VAKTRQAEMGRKPKQRHERYAFIRSRSRNDPLNSEFNEWGDASVDLYPTALRSEVDKINDRVYTTVNNGVYRCGFAKYTQLRGLRV